jgi:hypothetical protein
VKARFTEQVGEALNLKGGERPSEEEGAPDVDSMNKAGLRTRRVGM